MNVVKRIPLELAFWVIALMLLASAEPLNPHEENHFSFCVLAGMGIDWCPGCGLGRSLTQLLHGNVMESLDLHWFGIPALVVMGHRIGTLVKSEIKNFRVNYKEDKYV